MNFEFEIGEEVQIVISGETGRIIGRVEYEHGINEFLVFYKDGTRCAVTKWWSAEKLQRV